MTEVAEKMTEEAKLILLKPPSKKVERDEAKVSVQFTPTDIVNDDDIVLILSPKELQALIANYEVGSSNRLRSRLEYYKKTPGVRKRAELYFPDNLRIHKDSNLEFFAKP